MMALKPVSPEKIYGNSGNLLTIRPIFFAGHQTGARSPDIDTRRKAWQYSLELADGSLFKKRAIIHEAVAAVNQIGQCYQAFAGLFA